MRKEKKKKDMEESTKYYLKKDEEKVYFTKVIKEVNFQTRRGEGRQEGQIRSVGLTDTNYYI